jgi:hypothetical protein
MVSSTLVVVYSNQPVRTTDLGEYMYNLQKKLLLDIGSRSDLRGHVLNGSSESLNSINSYIDGNIPTAVFRYSTKICDLNNSAICKLNSSEVSETSDENVFVGETIIAADFGDYKPKKVRIFIWERG